MINPCRYCNKRQTGCHDHCLDYKNFKAKISIRDHNKAKFFMLPARPSKTK